MQPQEPYSGDAQQGSVHPLCAQHLLAPPQHPAKRSRSSTASSLISSHPSSTNPHTWQPSPPVLLLNKTFEPQINAFAQHYISSNNNAPAQKEKQPAFIFRCKVLFPLPKEGDGGLSVLHSNTVWEYSNHRSQRICANASKTNPKSNLLAGGDV